MDEDERRMSAAVVRRDGKGRFAKHVKLRSDSVFRQVSGAEITAFLDALSRSCNVSHACRVSGLKPRNAYRLRQYDADLRERWDRALEEGYAHLELEMLHRARFGAKTVTTETGAEGFRRRVVKHEYRDNVGMRLLTHHRASVERVRAARAAAGPAFSPDEAAERGLAKLRELLAARVAEREGSA